MARPGSLLLASLLLLSGACSKGGQRDRIDDDGGAVADSGVTGREDAGPRPEDLGDRTDLATRDPALCPVGAADGCCPLLRHGGTDPDCPSLACSSLIRSTPIELDPMAMNWEASGQASLAWTGRELAVAWAELVPGAGLGQTFIRFERYGLDGKRTFGPGREQIMDGSARVLPGVTDLGYDAVKGTYMMAVTHYGSTFAALPLDRDGKPGRLTRLGEYCNGLPAYLRVLPLDGEMLIAQQNYTCAGSTTQPRLDFLKPDASVSGGAFLGDGMRPNLTGNNPAVAYDPTTRRVLTIYSRLYETTLHGRYVDAVTYKVQPSILLGGEAINPTRERLGIAFDGKRYGVLTEWRQSYSAFAQYFQIYDPTTGWVGRAEGLGSPRAILPPSVIWTGSGFLIAAMTFEGPNSPSDADKYTSRLWSLAPDGTLRESFDIDRQPAIYPTLVWAGGRAALSWVRVQGGRYMHMLQWLSCS